MTGQAYALKKVASPSRGDERVGHDHDDVSCEFECEEMVSVKGVATLVVMVIVATMMVLGILSMLRLLL